MSLKELEQIRKFSGKEKRARQKYLQNLAQQRKFEENAKQQATKRKASGGSSKGKKSVKQTKKKQKTVFKNKETDDESTLCMICKVYWNEEQSLGLGRIWVECDKCKFWVHSDCSTILVP